MLKKRISNFILYNLIFIILIFGLSFAGFYLINYNIFKFKNYEKLDFFIEAFDYNDDSYLAKYKEGIVRKTSSSNTPILSSEIYCYSPLDTDYTNYFTKFGVNSDILILSSDSLKNLEEGKILKEYFVPLSEAFISSLNLDSNKYYINDEEIFGLQVYSKDDSEFNKNTNFDKLFMFDNSVYKLDFYLLINKNSVNFSSLMENNITNNGVDALNYLIEVLKE
ncbi:MAG: hypothetical protein IAC58_03280 [Firmicutes bacterium]|uniref:Uncharacterized protein n=1 Tax=Candidatus Onthovivens merdipullorum TaxID=2840889 RepID=A0A9D9DIU9_9BACL|nr:hypothetical protein [Candidatus Onthovivens merdipullorum]